MDLSRSLSLTLNGSIAFPQNATSLSWSRYDRLRKTNFASDFMSVFNKLSTPLNPPVLGWIRGPLASNNSKVDRDLFWGFWVLNEVDGCNLLSRKVGEASGFSNWLKLRCKALKNALVVSELFIFWTHSCFNTSFSEWSGAMLSTLSVSSLLLSWSSSLPIE